jgi:hypothetical protein
MTREPLEMYPDPTWEIIDPNTAQIVAVFYNETAAQEYLEWRNRRRGCEGCNAEPGEPCRWGCLSSVPLDTLIEAIELWMERPKRKRELIEAGDYLAQTANCYLSRTGATPVAPVIPDSKDTR